MPATRGPLEETAERVRAGPLPVMDLLDPIPEGRELFWPKRDVGEFLKLALASGQKIVLLYEEIERDFPNRGTTSLVEVAFPVGSMFACFLESAKWKQDRLGILSRRDLTIRIRPSESAQGKTLD
jgi:hypothetical protein